MIVNINGKDREATTEEEAAILEEQEAGKPGEALQRIRTGFGEALTAQVIWDGNTFDNRAESRADLNGILTNVLNGVTLPAGFAWRDASNVDHPFTVDDLKGLAAVMLANQWAAHQQKRVLLAQWEAATTAAEYEEIQWT